MKRDRKDGESGTADVEENVKEIKMCIENAHAF